MIVCSHHNTIMSDATKTKYRTLMLSSGTTTSLQFSLCKRNEATHQTTCICTVTLRFAIELSALLVISLVSLVCRYLIIPRMLCLLLFTDTTTMEQNVIKVSIKKEQYVDKGQYGKISKHIHRIGSLSLIGAVPITTG